METDPLSSLHETKQERSLCMRKNEQTIMKEEQTMEIMRSGENGMRGVVILLPIVRFNPLVECACGQGLKVLSHSTPSHNCLNYSAEHENW